MLGGVLKKAGGTVSSLLEGVLGGRSYVPVVPSFRGEELAFYAWDGSSWSELSPSDYWTPCVVLIPHGTAVVESLPTLPAEYPPDVVEEEIRTQQELPADVPLQLCYLPGEDPGTVRVLWLRRDHVARVAEAVRRYKRPSGVRMMHLQHVLCAYLLRHEDLSVVGLYVAPDERVFLVRRVPGTGNFQLLTLTGYSDPGAVLEWIESSWGESGHVFGVNASPSELAEFCYEVRHLSFSREYFRWHERFAEHLATVALLVALLSFHVFYRQVIRTSVVKADLESRYVRAKSNLQSLEARRKRLLKRKMLAWLRQQSVLPQLVEAGRVLGRVLPLMHPDSYELDVYPGGWRAVFTYPRGTYGLAVWDAARLKEAGVSYSLELAPEGLKIRVGSGTGSPLPGGGLTLLTAGKRL